MSLEKVGKKRKKKRDNKDQQRDSNRGRLGYEART